MEDPTQGECTDENPAGISPDLQLLTAFCQQVLNDPSVRLVATIPSPGTQDICGEVIGDLRERVRDILQLYYSACETREDQSTLRINLCQQIILQGTMDDARSTEHTLWNAGDIGKMRLWIHSLFSAVARWIPGLKSHPVLQRIPRAQAEATRNAIRLCLLQEILAVLREEECLE